MKRLFCLLSALALLLLPANTQQYDPIVIGKSDIVKLFIVQGIIVKKNL